MFTVALVAMTMTSCPVLYDRYGGATIEFSPGSVEIPDEGRNAIVGLLTPLVNDPLAEIYVDVNFPYSAREDTDPNRQLARTRLEKVKGSIVHLGISPDLIGGSLSAVGFTFGADYTPREIHFDPAELDRIRVRFLVKSDCHPLLELAHEMNPYR